MKRGVGLSILVALAILGAISAISEPALAQEPPWAPKRESGWYAEQRGFVAKLDLGGAYRRLYDVHFGAGEGTMTLGGFSPAGGFLGSVGVMVGETDQGLRTSQVVHTFAWQIPPLPDVHLGAGFRASYVAIRRASSDGVLETLGLGGKVYGAYDFYTASPVALSIDAAIVVDVLEDAPLYGVTLGVGARYF